MTTVWNKWTQDIISSDRDLDSVLDELSRVDAEMHPLKIRRNKLEKELNFLQNKCPHNEREPHPSTYDSNFESNWGDGDWIGKCLKCGHGS